MSNLDFTLICTVKFFSKKRKPSEVAKSSFVSLLFSKYCFAFSTVVIVFCFKVNIGVG